MSLRTLRSVLLIAIAIIPGIAGVTIFGLASLNDWVQLNLAYSAFEKVISQSSRLEQIYTAQSIQNIHRINLFADGTWTLLSGILAAVGVQGIGR